MLSTQDQMHALSHTANGLYELDDAERQRLQQVLLDMYRDVAEVCKRHHLTLLLGGGSALGAIRHQGFIPWDDDLDLMMPRKDYETFKRIFDAALGDRYVLQSPNAGTHVISNTYMKIIRRDTVLVEIERLRTPGLRGIYLDVFPIENAPASSVMRACKGFFADAMAYLIVSNYLFRYRTPAFSRYMSTSRPARINYRLRMTLGWLFGFLPYKTWYNLYDRFVRSARETDWVTIPTGRNHYRGETYRRADILPGVRATFEGEDVWVPFHSDVYLRRLYGDYLILPPEDKRERHFYVQLEF